ncbi:MAG TPA: M48 family metallopeptidase [Polyangiales bacterium]|nr:M48 family metallopeptidase [Polyangiales bacterium]
MTEAIELEGGVFSDELPSGRAGARISVGEDGVRAHTLEGQRFRLPFEHCLLELGGASGRMWFCRDQARSVTFFSEGPAFGAALAVHAPPALRAQLEAVEARARAAQSRSQLLWIAGLLVLAVLIGLAYFGVRRAAQASIDLVPVSADKKLGVLAFESMHHDGPETTDRVLLGAARDIVARLAKAQPKSDFTYNVHVVDADIVNAFALPGGEIVVYTGLLRAADTPEQLAGVLSHEMAHVDRRHGMRRIAQSIGVIGAVQLMFGDVSGISAVAIEVLRASTINAYSRDQEREADSDGVATLTRAQIDPNALADFFALLEKREASLPGALSWLGTHPDLAQRIETVHKLAKAQPSKGAAPFQINWAEVQAHAKKPQDE